MSEHWIVKAEIGWDFDRRSDEAVVMTLHPAEGEPLLIALSVETSARVLGQMQAVVQAAEARRKCPVDVPPVPERVLRCEARGEWTAENGPLAIVDFEGDRGTDFFGVLALPDAKRLATMLSGAVALLEQQVAMRQ